jgi:hypothetical protein
MFVFLVTREIGVEVAFNGMSCLRTDSRKVDLSPGGLMDRRTCLHTPVNAERSPLPTAGFVPKKEITNLRYLSVFLSTEAFVGWTGGGKWV